MRPDPGVLYKAFTSRDPRFDGVFFVGVASTGIYCRPICPARSPKPANCRFFPSAAAAELASFRPCLRCRPELAPGHAPVDKAARIAGRIADRIGDGLLEEWEGLEQIAAEFQVSARQLRRIVRDQLGVSPIELVQTRRLLLAKQLLTETALPISDIAFSSGFASLRRFNDAFRRRYGMPPSRLRRGARAPRGGAEGSDTPTLQLAYRPPFAWEAMLQFLQARAVRGVERVDGDAYLRTVRLGEHAGWIRVRPAPGKHALQVDVAPPLAPALPALLSRLRHLFDVTARPDLIADTLRRDPQLAAAVQRTPGLRVPGAFDGFELAVRAILGQQITVKAAATLAGRFAEAFGAPIETPHEGLDRLTPTAERIAAANVAQVAALGIVRTRAHSIVRLAREVAAGRLRLDAGAPPESTMQKLLALPGIGPWTAQYIAMRALCWPDAFPKEDIALRARLGGVTAARADALSQAWRPWRSYATLHLWRSQPAAGPGTPRRARAGR